MGTNPHFQNRVLCKAADQNRRPVREKDVCSDFNLTAQRLQMVVRKILETISGMVLNRSQPKFALKTVTNESDV